MKTMERDRFETLRKAMVDSQLRPSAVSDARVVEAMASVPREAYLPALLTDLAYVDAKLPLGGDRLSNPPAATGRMLTAAETTPNDRALLVGAAGGYAAAVLARLVIEVTALELPGALAAAAREALAKGDPDSARVRVVEGPLASGWAADAPYDVIIVDGAVEQIPPALVDQLAVGGRLVAGLVERGVCRLVVGRRSEGGFGVIDFADMDCAALPGFAPEPGFVF